MKKYIFLSIVVLCIFEASGFGQVSINSLGTPPNNSAMLDVESTTRGLLPPRMSSAQRTAIVSPASGLVVYDTDSASYYLHNGTGWCELVMEDETGTTIIGSSTNNTTIETDGTIKYTGSATVWEDIMVYPDATSRGSSNAPSWTLFKNSGTGSQGVWLYTFSATSEQEVYFTVQIPHGYKEESTLYPHVHWTTTTGTPSGTDVVWGFEYTAVAIGGTFSNTSTLTANSIIPGIVISGSGQHLITSFGTMNGAGLGMSSILTCRLYRVAANTNDTFASSVGLLGFDIHYERDTEGSRQEFIK